MFRYDSPIFRFMSKIADIIILNMLWLICSIPIFTIGSSTTALYYVSMKLIKNEEGYIVKDFFRSFKQNFKQATALTFVFAFIAAFFVTDIRLLTASGQQLTGIQSILRIIFVIALVILFMIAEYSFPMLAKFDNTIKNTIKNAFVLGFIDLKSLISITFVNSVIILLIVLTPNTFVKLLFVCIVVGISGPAYINAYTFNKIFDKYIKKDEETKNSDNVNEDIVGEGSSLTENVKDFLDKNDENNMENNV